MPFKDTAAKVRNGVAKPQVPQAWSHQEPEPPSSDPQRAYMEDGVDSMDDEGSQNSEEFHRNVAPKKNNLTDVLSLLKDGRGNSPEPAEEDEDQGHVTSSDAAASDEHLAPISKPWEFDGTNKRKFKLTTKQLRRMFSPRKLSGHNPTSSRRSTQRVSDESTEDFDHEELSSFASEDNDEWIEEFVQAPERRDSWRAPGSLEEQRLLRVTNDDLQEACLRGDLGLVKRLIAAGASVNAPMRPQDATEFMTLLHVLARKPHMQNCSSIIAEMVRNKANLNVRSSFGTTPLSLACHAKHVEAVEVLLRAKASADPVDDFGRKAPLYAILPPWDNTLVDNTDENLTVKTVQLLARARTNLDDGGAHAPIVEAVKLQNFPAVAALLACAVEPKGLHEAVEEGSLDIMDALIIAQANPFVKDDKSRTVMDVALATNDEEVINTIRDFIGDLRRQKHQHLKMMEENREEEEAQDALDRDNFLEPTEAKETIGGRKGAVAGQEEASEYFAALGSLARSVFKLRSFQAFMFLCLFVALFAADIFVISNLDNDVALDTILVVLLCAFILEFGVQVLAYRRTYTCSFYFWMDLVGILSVPLDHSLVVNALPNGLDSNTTIMRAARMAKLGARAGRFTRLVKLLRFLPFMQSPNTGGTAKVISAALNIALSMRVSLLIILMVLVLPLFQLATFPENDYSMVMWVEMLGDTASVEPQYLEEVFGNFTAFYASSNFFPFQATYQLNGADVTRSLNDPPVRPRASVQLQSGTTLVLFNFTTPQQVDAGLNCLLMVTIMVLMVVSALFLSNTVSHIVLTPLEQLLDHVHHMSANIFKSMAALGTKSVNNSEDGDDQDSADAFGTETKLLDQVLKKIIALSKITVKKSPIDSDSLRRLGGGADLSWLQAYSNDLGLNEVAYQNAVLLEDVPLSDVDVQDLANLITTMMEDVSIDWDVFQQWELDTLDLTTQDRHNLSLCLLFSQRANAIRDKVKNADEFQNCCAAFLKECAAGYERGKLAPYHTFGHAVDATFTLWRTLDLIAAETYLGHLECFGLTVAALAHDIGHMGRSNVFLTEIEHDLAICYNDMSCLENMHCSKLFQILAKEECNLFSELNQVIYSHIRHIIVDSIIATDFAQHGGMVKEFESMYGVNAELFDTADEMYMNTEEFPPRELMEYFKTPDVKKTLRTVLLHFADISNPMKPFPVAERWAELVLKEFALQGDEEKALGIPVGPLNDKKTVNLPLSQIGFIEFVVAPLALAMARVLPPVWFTNQMIIDNANIWMDRWIEDTLLKPSFEEQVAVRERIHKMVQKTEQRGFTATMAQMEN